MNALFGIAGLVCKPSNRMGAFWASTRHMSNFIDVMWGLIVDTLGMKNRGIYERIASSGVVFSEKPAVKGDQNDSSHLNKLLFRLIEEEIELSFRSQNCLNNAGIKLIGQLVQKTEAELINLKNFGRTSLREIGNTLTEMGLTLEMTLDFPPWNGDSNDSELIQVLSLQRVGGGFHIDHKAADKLGFDLEKLKTTAVKLSNSVAADRHLILSTAMILNRLEERHQERIPCLLNVIQRNQQWLKKQLKQDSTAGIFKLVEI
jgi:hypothetical protein